MILNQATLSIDGSQNNLSVSDDPQTPQADDPTAFTVGGELDLKITKAARVDSGEASAQSDDVITWTIRVQNQGLAPALQLTILDEIANELEYISESMILDRRRVSDSPDLDPAEFIEMQESTSGQNVAQLEPGAELEFSFQTRVTRDTYSMGLK